jgi:histidine ammonia-lyase
MGMTTAIKTRQIIDNAYGVLGIEFIAAAQAFDFRQPAKPASATKVAYDVIRKYVAHLEEDRPLFDDNNAMVKVIRSGEILDKVEIISGILK